MQFDFTKIQKSFQEVEDYLKQEYLQISTGRANPALLDAVFVESYGTKQAIKNIASINTEDPRTMKISPWDKSQIPLIEKALYDSKLPFSVSVDETGVRVSIPQLTEESKKSLLKLLKEKLEAARVKVRNIRQEGMHAIEAGEKNGDYAEDDMHRFKEELQKMVDEANKKLDTLYQQKEEAVMSV